MPVKRPQPNFWWSLLACVGLIVVEFVAMLGVWLVVWLISCFLAGDDPQKLMQADMNALQRYSAPNAQPGEADTEPFPPRLGLSIMAGTAAAFLAMFLYTWILLRLVLGRGWKRKIALRRPGAAQLLIAVLLFLPGLACAHEAIHALLAWLFNSTPGEAAKMLMAASDAAPIWLALLAIAVGPGLVEELFCRGFIGHGLVGRHGWVLGVLLTSILFGALHLEPLYAVGTLVMGLGLHFAYATSRSLWVPVLLHMLNNGLSVLMVKLPGVENMTPGLMALRYGSAVALLALGGWALWSSRTALVPVTDEPTRWRQRYPGVELPPDGSWVVKNGRLPLTPIALALVPLVGLICSYLMAN
jgi:membrane protease YdiL (CAAX protease family)